MHSARYAFVAAVEYSVGTFVMTSSSVKRISHDFDELKVKMWHGLTSDGRLDASASHASVGYERTIFKFVAICCR